MKIWQDRQSRTLLLSVWGATVAAFLISEWLVFRRIGAFSALLGVVFLLLAVALTVILLGYLAKLERRYADAAQTLTRFLSGDAHSRIPCEEEGGLARLFQSVNALTSALNAKAERESENRAFLKNAVSDISHQLKTPLSAIRLYQELIEGTDELSEIRRFAVSSQEELDRMNALLVSFLKLTRLDAGAVELSVEKENVAELMGSLCARFSDRAAAEKKTLRFTGGDVFLCCDAAWLSEAFANIIKNALDHTDAGATVEVEWRSVGEQLHIAFRDDGRGIHPEDLPHIFKRFYRSRFSSDTSGIGLGLPLAKSVIEAHGGVIEAESEPGHGTVFSVTFMK